MGDVPVNGEVLERLKGVFSLKQSSYIGTGTTRKKTTKRFFFYAEERNEGFLRVQKLGENWLPTGKVSTVAKPLLISKYHPEPDIFVDKTLPAMRKLASTIAKAERLRKNGEVYTAEFEYKNALQMDEGNVRAMFGLGLTYMDREENDKAQGVFEKLYRIEEAFQVENKHLFNEFGIRLRKAGMHDQALKYYAKAYKLAGNDENLLFNMARIYYDKGDLKRAALFVKQALCVNPDFAQGREFARTLKVMLKRAASAA